MGFLSALRDIFRMRSAGSGGGSSSFGNQANVTWVYARCQRCGEALRGRINMANEPSLADDGETWIVRKGLMGSGKNLCFQTVDVMLRFDARKDKIIESSAAGGSIITAEDYEANQSIKENSEHA